MALLRAVQTVASDRTPEGDNPSGDLTLDYLHELGVPITRRAYINVQWFGEPPAEWTVEEEGMMPPELQNWDLFEERGGQVVLKKGADIYAMPKGEFDADATEVGVVD